MPAGNNNYEPYRNATRVTLAVILVISATGYFMGLRQTASTAASRDLSQIVPHQEQNSAAPEALDYSRMNELPKPNAGWSNSLAALQIPNFNLLETNAPATPEQRGAATQARLERRAFDGAPPVTPHPIDQSSSASCLACHGEGKVVKGRVAARISHAHYSNCTQCHVPSGGFSRASERNDSICPALRPTSLMYRSRSSS